MARLGWRLWRHVGREEFPAYHRAWWFGRLGLQPVLWPGVAVHALGSVAQLYRPPATVPRTLPAAVLGLQVGSGVLTALWWGRQQARTDQVRRPDGTLDPRYTRLLATHWLRVALITASAAGRFAVAARSMASLPDPDRVR